MSRGTDRTSVPAPQSGVHTVAVDGDAFLLDKVTGRLVMRNVTGALGS